MAITFGHKYFMLLPRAILSGAMAKETGLNFGAKTSSGQVLITPDRHFAPRLKVLHGSKYVMSGQLTAKPIGQNILVT